MYPDYSEWCWRTNQSEGKWLDRGGGLIICLSMGGAGVFVRIGWCHRLQGKSLFLAGRYKDGLARTESCGLRPCGSTVRVAWGGRIEETRTSVAAAMRFRPLIGLVVPVVVNVSKCPLLAGLVEPWLHV